MAYRPDHIQRLTGNMIVIDEWDIGGIMFFIWLLVMFSTSEITDAIKESKEK